MRSSAPAGWSGEPAAAVAPGAVVAAVAGPTDPGSALAFGVVPASRPAPPAPPAPPGEPSTEPEDELGVELEPALEALSGAGSPAPPVAVEPPESALLARAARATAGSGNGWRSTASSVCAVTQVGVWSDEAE